MTVAEVMALPQMASSRVLAGAEGLSRTVQRLNMMEVPDVLPWVRHGELLVTSGYPLRDLSDDELVQLLRELSDRGLSGLCIKVGRFVPRLSPKALAVADEAGFAVVSMPPSLSFTDLLGAVLTEQLDRQEAALRASDEIDRLLLTSLLQGGSHREIAAALSGWVDADVSIVDADGAVLARASPHAAPPGATPATDDDAAGQERVDVADLPHDDADVLASSGDLTAACIRRGGTVDGYLVAAGQRGPLGPGQLLAVRRAAPVAALAFARAREIAAVEARYRGDFLRTVLTGTTSAGVDVAEHARMLVWELQRELVVGVAEAPAAGADPRDACARIARALDRELASRWSGCAVHGFASEVVIILPAVPRARLLAALREVCARLPAPDRELHLGTSRVVEGPQRLPEAYRQAREALQVSLRSAQVPEVVAFDDIGLARMVAVMTESDLAAPVVADALGPLLAERNGEEMLVTLETFLGANCNIAATARALHFHYNTVRYRVSRLEALLGGFVDDAERRAELLTACRLRTALRRDA